MSRKAFFLLVLLVLTAAFSVFIYENRADNVRRVFLFESYDTDEDCMEVRYLHQKEGDAAVDEFLDELLLGPMGDRNKRLFSFGTVLNSCFIRDGILYVDLSSEALLSTLNVTETDKACVLLKKNVMLNFNEISEIRLFIAGGEVYVSNE